MVRVVSAAVVMMDVAIHGWSLMSQVSPTSIGFAALAVTFGVCPLVRRWSDAIFTGEEQPTPLS